MAIIKNEDIIIFGRPGYNTLGLIRCLQRDGINFFLLIVQFNSLYATLLSKGVNRYKIVKTEEEGIDFLLKMADSCKRVIIPTSDKVELLLDKNFDLLKENYFFPNAGTSGRVAFCMDKYVMLGYAKQNDIIIPYTCVYNIDDELPNNIVFPCLIKPKTSCNGSKADIAICETRDELVCALRKSKVTQSFLIQEYVKKDYDILVIGCRLQSSGKVVYQGVFKKERWSEVGGDGSFGLIDANVSNYVDVDKLTKFLVDLDYFGPFSLEFGCTNGKLYFFEINMRNDGTSHYFAKLGTNVALLWALDALGMDVSSKKYYKGEMFFIDEIGDVVNVFTTKLKFKDWIRDFRRAKVYKYFDKSDILPFLFLFPRRFLKTIWLILKKGNNEYEK